MQHKSQREENLVDYWVMLVVILEAIKGIIQIRYFLLKRHKINEAMKASQSVMQMGYS